MCLMVSHKETGPIYVDDLRGDSSLKHRHYSWLDILLNLKINSLIVTAHIAQQFYLVDSKYILESLRERFLRSFYKIFVSILSNHEGCDFPTV